MGRNKNSIHFHLVILKLENMINFGMLLFFLPPGWSQSTIFNRKIPRQNCILYFFGGGSPGTCGPWSEYYTRSCAGPMHQSVPCRLPDSLPLSMRNWFGKWLSQSRFMDRAWMRLGDGRLTWRVDRNVADAGPCGVHLRVGWRLPAGTLPFTQTCVRGTAVSRTCQTPSFGLGGENPRYVEWLLTSSEGEQSNLPNRGSVTVCRLDAVEDKRAAERMLETMMEWNPDGKASTSLEARWTPSGFNVSGQDGGLWTKAAGAAASAAWKLWRSSQTKAQEDLQDPERWQLAKAWVGLPSSRTAVDTFVRNGLWWAGSGICQVLPFWVPSSSYSKWSEPSLLILFVFTCFYVLIPPGRKLCHPKPRSRRFWWKWRTSKPPFWRSESLGIGILWQFLAKWNHFFLFPSELDLTNLLVANINELLSY